MHKYLLLYAISVLELAVKLEEVKQKCIRGNE